MRILISLFSPAKELGTRANQKISGYNRIQTAENDSNTLRVDAKIFVSAKKNVLRKKKFPDTFGHGPSLKEILMSPLLFSESKGCMRLYGNLAGGLRNWDSTPFYQVQLLESTTYLCYAPSALS